MTTAREARMVKLGNQLVAGLGSQIAEHCLRVLVAAFNRRAGEAAERRLGQRIAHVLGEAINEIVLAAVRFVGDDDNIAPVGQQQMFPAFFIGKEFLNGGEHHAAAGHVEQLAQQHTSRAEGFFQHRQLGPTITASGRLLSMAAISGFQNARRLDA